MSRHPDLGTFSTLAEAVRSLYRALDQIRRLAIPRIVRTLEVSRRKNRNCSHASPPVSGVNYVSGLGLSPFRQLQSPSLARPRKQIAGHEATVYTTRPSNLLNHSVTASSAVSNMSSKKSKSSAKSTKKTAVPEPTPPNWPVFKPLRPIEDLEIETVAESQIVVIRNFWTSTLCKDYVSFLKTLPLVTTPGAPKKGEALRVNDRFQCQSDTFANRLWVETGLRELVCGINEDENINDDEKYKLWYVYM